jgi:cytochrome d ubiquinol oxidase subunit II
MTLAEGVVAVMWVGVTLYAVFAGADFGAGFWDLLAGGARRGAPQRSLIERSIGPVWEANHVWLIFVLVILWTGFPRAFAPIMTTLYVPLTAAAIGIILRGSAFAFRKAVPDVEMKRVFGVAFALSSVVTPFFLGAVAGAVASGRVARSGTGGTDPFEPWLQPTSMLGGTLAVAVCAYLAATFLTVSAQRAGDDGIVASFRQRAIGASIAAGAVALGGVAVLASDAPDLFDGLTGRALPLLVLSAVAGLLSLVLVVRRRYEAARLAAVVAVVAVVWGWGAGQYPYMLEPGLTIQDAAGARSTLLATAISLGVGAALFAPPLVWLLATANRGDIGERLAGGAPEPLVDDEALG